MIELSPLAVGGIGVAALLALCFVGVRFAFAGAIVGTGGLVWLIGWDAGIRTAGIAPYTSGANYTLSVLPMFILIGYLAYYAGITQSAFEAARRWFGWLPGGLATGTVFAVAGFSAVSGASSAAAAVFAKVAIPEMLRAKYDKRLAAGVCAAGATLDSLIPPSTLLVVYGIITEQSIGKLLIAGFVPGIVSALVYAMIITWRCWRNPELGPRITGYSLHWVPDPADPGRGAVLIRTVKRRAIGTPYRRRIGTPFIRGSAARRVAINQRSASPLGEPPPSHLRPEGGLGGG